MLAIFAICILTVCAQKSGSDAVFNAEVLEEGRRGEIIELSNNRIIESEEASVSGSDDSHGATETRSGESGSGLQTASGKDEASAVERRSRVSLLQNEEVNVLSRSISPERSEHCEAMSLEGCVSPLQSKEGNHHS